MSWFPVRMKILVLGMTMMLITITVFFYDIQRYVSNDQVYGKFRSKKIGKKCTHLSNFPIVTLQALCESLLLVSGVYSHKIRRPTAPVVASVIFTALRNEPESDRFYRWLHVPTGNSVFGQHIP
jgi:hypothetical protein